MSKAPWAWRCRQCEKLLSGDEIVQRHGQYWHWDPLLQEWCGPAEKVELR